MISNGSRLLILLSAASPVAAAPVTCPDLAVPSTFALPAGQTAATTAGPSKPVDAPREHVELPAGPAETIHIRLERTECYGTCPSYSVELGGDGTASYDGKAFVLVPGHHTFDVAKSAVQCLEDQFRKADFWSLADVYSADITDGSTYRLTLSVGGESKTVTDYFGSLVGLPRLVTAIENEIDEVAGVDRWIKGNAETVSALRAEHFDFRSPAAATIVANAAYAAPPDLIASLIAAGSPATGRASSIFGIGLTATARASQAGRLPVVRSLIAAGALSNASAADRDAALFAAARSGDPAIVAEILRFKPDVNARARDGRTPLMAMWADGTPSKPGRDMAGVARELLAAGADPNVFDGNQRTALFSAEDAATVRLLIEAGAKIGLIDRFGDSPLLTATSDDAASALIQAGADVKPVNLRGEDIAKRAQRMKFSKTLWLLGKGVAAN